MLKNYTYLFFSYMTEFSNISYINFLKYSGISVFLKEDPNNLYEKNTQKKTSSNITNIENIKNIEDLKTYIVNFITPILKKRSKHIIFGNGNTNSNIMIIGDPPNDEDEKEGKFMSGEAGKLLKKMLGAINLELEAVYLNTIIPWKIQKNQEPSNKEILLCLPFIEKYIELIKPSIILLMGQSATKGLLTTNLAISELRGKWHEYKSIHTTQTIKCLVTHDPRLLLKFPNFKRQAWEDLKMIQQKILDENL